MSKIEEFYPVNSIVDVTTPDMEHTILVKIAHHDSQSIYGHDAEGLLVRVPLSGGFLLYSGPSIDDAYAAKVEEIQSPRGIARREVGKKLRKIIASGEVQKVEGDDGMVSLGFERDVSPDVAQQIIDMQAIASKAGTLLITPEAQSRLAAIVRGDKETDDVVVHGSAWGSRSK